MNVTPQFLRFAAVCCFITVITTLGIHLYFPDPPSDFEQRILLYQDTTYLLNRWWVIVHCLLVIISMWGMALALFRRSPGFTGLGFLFFAVFGIAEIARQLFVLFYLNELREQYHVATDTAIRDGLKNTLNSAGLLTTPLFGLFILSFGLANLFYGLSMNEKKGLTKVLSVLLIVWGISTLISFGNSFWSNPAISTFMDHFGYTFQPLMRLLLGIWLWKKASTLSFA